MDKIYIYRVENENGYGCYCCHLPELEKMYNRHAELLKCPLPLTDIGIERNIKGSEICGFINKKQALKWFSHKDLKLLSSFGFELKKVEVKIIVAKGEKQVLAVRDTMNNKPLMIFYGD